ncbi:MAG: hypothetical protein RL693_2365 [Verrucomicrobiota bacterium]
MSNRASGLKGDVAGREEPCSGKVFTGQKIANNYNGVMASWAIGWHWTIADIHFTHQMKRFLKFILGLIALVMGLTIIIWCIYSSIVPNEDFQLSIMDIPRLFVPLALVWFGWNWIRGESTKAESYSSGFAITIKLSDDNFGASRERDTILDLKHRLEDKLGHERAGEIDGEEFGGGECVLFIQTNHPARAKKLAHEFFVSESSDWSYTVSQSE